MTETLKNMTHIWDSKVQAQNMLRNRLNIVKLKYNKEEGVYENS